MTKTKLILIFLLAFCSIVLQSQEAEDAIFEEGKLLFRNNCKSCHNLDKRLVGPPLSGVLERRDSLWLYNFIRSSQTMIESGDEIAVSLFDEYGQVPMPDQKIGDENIAKILNYIKVSDLNANAPDANPIKRPESQPIVYSEALKFSNYLFWIPFTIAVILFSIVLYYLTIHHDIVRPKENI